jgi:hypothetical protein
VVLELREGDDALVQVDFCEQGGVIHRAIALDQSRIEQVHLIAEKAGTEQTVCRGELGQQVVSGLLTGLHRFQS